MYDIMGVVIHYVRHELWHGVLVREAPNVSDWSPRITILCIIFSFNFKDSHLS